jgi:pimeloyl-ACP methyl ester carboxylesterase
VALGFRGETDAVPLLPPDAPDLAATVAAARAHLGPADQAERTLVLGHSVGVQATLRATSELPEGVSVGALLLVAGWWTVDRPWPSIVPWIETPFAWERTRTAARRRVVLLSSNDPFTADVDRTRHLFEERIGADVRIHDGAKHFNATEEPSVLAVACELLGLPAPASTSG